MNNLFALVKFLQFNTQNTIQHIMTIVLHTLDVACGKTREMALLHVACCNPAIRRYCMAAKSAEWAEPTCVPYFSIMC